MADLGPDGRLIVVRQALGEDTFRRISAGTTRDEVLRLIGPPSDTMAFERMGQVAWMWRFRDLWGYTADYSVTFDSRWIAVSTFTTRLERERRP
jgi:hypothetical protein